jgi:hypothetical protein
MLPNGIPNAPLTNNSTVFLHGPAGTGKTTLARRRLRALLRAGVPAQSVAVMVPQRTLGLPFQAGDSGRFALPAEDDGTSAPDMAWAPVDVVTLGGLAQRAVDLFWPLVSADAGFANPLDPPVFLTLETAQYYMSRHTERVSYYGGLQNLHVSPPRLASQVLDNLNKAAVVGFPMEEIAERLKSAWVGGSEQLKVYDAAQEAAIGFRTYCLEHNLLDFSLQVDLFRRHLLSREQVQRFLFGRYRHLIADNVEEDTPVAHDLVAEWLGRCDSALVVMDDDAGYRLFLGADTKDALRLAALCRHRVEVSLPAPWQGEAARRVQGFGRTLAAAVDLAVPGPLPTCPEPVPWQMREYRFLTEMAKEVANEVSGLVTREGVRPRQIAILAPYLSGALRFSLATALDGFGLATRSHRPSRSLAEEPATTCLLTLAALAHPQWSICPPPADVALALTLSIGGMDLVRAHLLQRLVYQMKAGVPYVAAFHQLKEDARQRVTYVLGTAWDELRDWLLREGSKDWPLDFFLTLLFDQVLSRRGFGFHRDLEHAAVTARLVESVRKFRQAVPAESLPQGRGLGQEYIGCVNARILAATSLAPDRLADAADADMVFLAPAYTFLLGNTPVDYQFWLDVGSAGWGERIYQPLTQPHVLSRRFGANGGDGRDAADPMDYRKWTDADESAAECESMRRLVLGLTRRCRKGVIMAIVSADESGRDERGPLLLALQRMLRAQRPRVP